MLLPSRFYNWSSVMAPSTVTSRSPHPSTAVCSPPVQTDPTSTARFEAASATSASGGPDETPLHEWALQNSGQKNKRHWASACPSHRRSDRARLQVGVAFQAAPEIPTGHGAIRPPSLGHLLHFLRSRERFQIVGFADSVADAQIPGGQDVAALQGEDQEHVGGPDADAFDLGEAEDDLVVGEGGEILEDHFPIEGVAREVADVGGLLGGEPQRAHAGGAEFEDGFGSDYALDGGGQPAEDHTGDASAELLEDDRLDQGLEIRRAELDTIIAYVFDNGGEHRVVGAEVVDGLLHGETRTRRAASTLLYRDANTYTWRAHDWQRTAGAGPDALHQSRRGSGQHSDQRPG